MYTGNDHGGFTWLVIDDRDRDDEDIYSRVCIN